MYALFEDREGTIWVGTSEGLDRFREWPVTPLSVKQGLSSSTATSVLAARDGSIWIGTADGLNRLREGRTTIYRRRNDPGLPDDAIQSLFEDERGRIWVSGSAVLRHLRTGSLLPCRGYLAGLPTRSQATTAAACGLVCGLQPMITCRRIWSTAKLSSRPLAEAGWRRWDRSRVRPGRRRLDGATEWRGCAFSLGTNTEHVVGRRRANITRKVLNVSRDRDGTMWVTEDGLSRITNGRVATLTTANGLPCNTVH